MHKDRHLKTRNERHVVNKLIDGLPSKERASVLGRCDVVEIAFGKVLFETGPNIRHAYFPLNGFISLLTLLDGRQPLEMALIGNEGMVGITLTLGVSTAPMRAIVQGTGGALFEAIQFADGRILNAHFADYRLPRFKDTPVIEIVLVDRKDLPSAGAGETGLVGLAPALGNAIFAASGTRLRNMPMAPGKAASGTTALRFES